MVRGTDEAEATGTGRVGPTVLWLRDDLRTNDHEALSAACADGGPVVALWIREEPATGDDCQPLGPRPLGAAARWWTHQSLAELTGVLRELGIPLLFARGDARVLVPAVARHLGATTVRWQRRYAPAARTMDAEVKQLVAQAGIDVHSHPGALLVEPWTVTTKAGEPFSVFTPFHTAAAEAPVPPPLPSPAPVAAVDGILQVALDALAAGGTTCDLDGLELLDHRPEWWRETVACHWTPGESAARERVGDLRAWLDGYRTSREKPGDPEATSRLSPHLRAGEVSPRTLLHATLTGGVSEADRQAWVHQLYWREFCWHLAYHRPDVATRPMRPEFDHFPYEPDPALADAWRRGSTGIDLVDAGMRQLWQTGWMHNRVRMVTASLFTKNLLQPWWEGEQWFWDTLVDADEANNPVSWQWVAGCGADAAPYFRVFNPDLQRDRFDPDGEYLNRWLPQGPERPAVPVVDLKESRLDALRAHEAVRTGGRTLPRSTVQPSLLDPDAGPAA